MATIVFQSTTTQPPVESQFNFMEPQPLSLRLRLSPLSVSHQPFDQSPIKPTSEFPGFSRKIKTLETGAWDFLEGPQEPLHAADSTRTSSAFSGPSSPSSASSCFSTALSENSLKLCTEDLGNESGSTEITEVDLLSSVSSPEGGDRLGNSPKRTVAPYKRTGPRSFPPPLTTIGGREAIQFRPHRADGRLVIEAVRDRMAYNSLQADRSEGRLRLCFFKEQAPVHNPEPIDCQEMSQKVEVEGDSLCEEKKDLQEEGEKEEQEEEEDDYLGRDRDENNEKSEVKTGNLERFPRPGRRCTESDEASESKIRLMDWGHFLVATS